MAAPSHNLAVRVLDGALGRGLAGKVALREGERAWTYAQLADQIGRVSSALRMLRIQRGERIAVLMRDTLEAAASILGVLHAGAVAVPLSELARAADVMRFLDHAGVVAAIVDSELEPVLDEVRAEIPGLREILCVGARSAGERDFHAVVRAAAPAPVAVAVEPSDVAMILYSAGVTGDEIRGVPHSHSTPMVAFDGYACGVLGLGEDDRVFSVARLATAYGLSTALLYPLAAGAESLLLPEQARSEALFTAIERFAPTVMFATPSVYGQLVRDALMEARDAPLAGLRACVSGAEAMPDKLIGRIRDILGAHASAGYGLTEAFQFVLMDGRAVPGVELRVVDDDGRPIGASEIGTLQVRGPTVFAGYWGDRADDSAADAAGWFTTRDRFLVDDAGGYRHCGRVDDLFKVGGKWVSPVEVERALTAHEAVWECAVIGADDEDGLIKPLAFVVTNVGHAAGGELEAELREYVKQSLAPYKYPRWIEFVDSLPRGPGGKLLRYALKPQRRRRRAETAQDI